MEKVNIFIKKFKEKNNLHHMHRVQILYQLSQNLVSNVKFVISYVGDTNHLCLRKGITLKAMYPKAF